MSLSRRKFLNLAGGGVVLAAGAGAFIGTRTPTSALAPWDAAGVYADPRLRALSYALLAPNPHNRQPWEARLEREDTLILTRDPDRNLPHTDPFDRQIVIGMGCFIELMVEAAAEEGLAVDLDLFPDGDGPRAPVAVARFLPGGVPDPLFSSVMERRSCKQPFDMDRPVSEAQLLGVHSATVPGVRAGGTIDAAEVDALRALTWRAAEIETYTERTFLESIELSRVGKAEIEANPDGISLGGPIIEILKLLGQLDAEDMLDPSSKAFKASVDIYREMLLATPAYVWLATRGNSRQDQIAAGRAWVRTNLKTTAMGLALHPVSQALQEFSEMAGPYAEIHATLAEPGETVQMLGRLGHGPATPRTPRWALETRLRNA